ncbi:MAG: type II/IV secretion system protein, partial [Planctomycetota bacterium]
MDIGEILVRRGLLTPEQLAQARAQSNGHRVDQVAVKLGYVSEEEALKTLAEELGMRYVDLHDFQVDRKLLGQFPTAAIYRYALLPIRDRGHAIEVAVSDPFELESLDELSSLTGRRLEPVLAQREELLRLIKENLGVAGDTITQLVAQRAEDGIELVEELPEIDSELAKEAQEASVIRLVNQLLLEALETGATDVHIEPQEHDLRIRFRIDGMLRNQPVPPEIKHFFSAIVTRLKIMSRLNIAEKRLPQDGRIQLRVNGRDIDVRVSIIPMLHGEGVVLRMLDKGRMVFDLKNVGMPDDLRSVFRELITIPHGIILVTGPTGSGKTTTLYSCLNEILSPAIKIITVEDPVEYHMDGISQIQVHEKIGLTFARGLRSILRHDPDVVLVGEIRDGETAEAAIQAALTGHLVFSTLHTNDASGAFTRLIDMGVEPYLVASTVEGVMAQRLVRKLCPDCKQPYRPGDGDVPRDFVEFVREHPKA